MCGLIGAEELALASIVTATGDDLSSAWAAFAETVNSVQLTQAAEINLINNLTSTSFVVSESNESIVSSLVGRVRKNPACLQQCALMQTSFESLT